MTKIVIDRPPSPLPPLTAPARKWVPKAEWAKRAAERDQRASVSEPLDIGAKLRRLLMGDAR